LFKKVVGSELTEEIKEFLIEGTEYEQGTRNLYV
jgi:hypothetical protein